MRLLVFVHRWLGVALSLLVLLWFLSGVVLMYRGFPAVTPADRLARAPVLDPARVRVSAADAYAQVGWAQSPAAVRLTSFDDRPVYRFEEGSGQRRMAVVYADDGTERGAVDTATIDRAASRWAQRDIAEAVKNPVTEVDQWTVGGRLRTLRPLYKYAWPDGQHVYVDGRTAEVVQYTTTSARIWAHLGAIPHWLYYTPLRKHPETWSSVIVWSSGAATLAAILGLAIGTFTSSPRKRYRHDGRPTAIPYRHWKRWHAIAGLAFGVITATWTFSGLLSMGPFPITERLGQVAVDGDATDTGTAQAIELAMTGDATVDLAAYADRPVRSALEAIADFDAREFEYRSFAGEPFYLASNASGDTRVVPIHGATRSTFDTEHVMRVVRAASGGAAIDVRVIDRYDTYYFDRRGERPLPVVLARVSDAERSRIYIDPRTASVVHTYGASGWVDRWLYRGLHSFAFPWLYTHRPLWDIVVVALMLGGTLLSATSVLLAWRVIVGVLGRRRLAQESR